MSTTMKKSEMLAAIKADTIVKLPLDEIGAVQIDAGLWAVPGPVLDGIQTYAKVSITAANPIGTDKVPAFDLDEDVENWKMEQEEREAKAKEKAEAKAKREAEKAAKTKDKS